MRISDWSSDVCSSDLLAQSAGATITEQYGHISWDVDGLQHQRRARTVAARLRKMPGVIEAEASASGHIRAEFMRREVSDEDIRRVLGTLGVRRLRSEEHTSELQSLMRISYAVC